VVLVGFEMTDYTVAETGGVNTVCFSQRGALERAITVTVTTVDGTASGEVIPWVQNYLNV